MNLTLQIVLFYIPLFLTTLILGIFYKKIKWYFWFVAIFSGMVAIIPSVLIQFFVPNILRLGLSSDSSVSYSTAQVLLSLLLGTFILNGLIEEGFKTIFSMVLLPNRHNLKEFLLLCLIMALSFATFENVVYIILGMGFVALRMISATLVHLICSVLNGFFIWNAFQKKLALRPIFCSVVVHTLYNFFVSLNGAIRWAAIAVVLFGIFECILFYDIYRASGTRIRDPKSPRLVR